MKLDGAIQRYLRHLAANDCSVHTIRSYPFDSSALCGFLGARGRYCRILCSELLIQAASSFTPSTKRTPLMTSAMISHPLSARQRLAAL